MSDMTIGSHNAFAKDKVTTVTATDTSLLIMRLALGILFLAHGSQKVLGLFGGYGYNATVHSMMQSGLPAAIAYLVPLIEFLGGLGLIFGVLARLSAFGIICVMLGAIFTVHLKNGLFMNWFGNQKGEGIEYHILAIAIALAILLIGPGRFSIIDIERRIFARK